MSREVHVRFCERPGVKFLRPTHPQITTVQDGKVWLFGVIEHWNAELVGWHVAKRGTRFEATQAISMAVCHEFGHLSPGVARGLALRHDLGSNSWPSTSRPGFAVVRQTRGISLVSQRLAAGRFWACA